MWRREKILMITFRCFFLSCVTGLILQPLRRLGHLWDKMCTKTYDPSTVETHSVNLCNIFVISTNKKCVWVEFSLNCLSRTDFAAFGALGSPMGQNVYQI